MRPLLFDMQSGGHHLEYAGKLLRELNEFDDIDAEFLHPWETDRDDEHLPAANVRTLFEDGPPSAEQYDPTTNTGQHNLLKQAATFVETSDYDLVHFLHVDFSSRWIYDAFRGMSDTVPMVGTLNGAYFVERKWINRTIHLLLASPLAPFVSRLAPENPSRHLNLYRLVASGVLDHLFVHSEAAREHVCSYTHEDRVTVIPDPLECWYRTAPDRAAARDQMGLPEEGLVVLYFGEIRREKGVDILLEALQRYRGPEITIVIAGKPRDMTADEITTASTGPSVTLRTDLGYVPNEDVPKYYAAADVAVLPYRRSFGPERTSGVYQNVLGSLTPVIVPDFGTFEDRTRRHGLGITFPAESPDGLAAAIERFAREGEQTYDVDAIRAYADSQSYDRLASISRSVYQSVSTPGTRSSTP